MTRNAYQDSIYVYLLYFLGTILDPVQKPRKNTVISSVYICNGFLISL